MEWIKFTEKQPEAGQEINVKFNVHRHGLVYSNEERLGKYIGMNSVIDMPMVEFDYESDDYYIEATHWKPI